MQSTIPSTPVSKKRLVTGRVLSGFAILFLLFDSVIKLLKLPPAVQGTIELGDPESVLLTGYLGGAVATNVRVGNPLFSHVLFPIYVAILIWGGLYLRDGRVRALIRPRS